jgi:hypothetical protein
MTAFRNRGWHDQGAALAIVRVLESDERSATPERLSRAVGRAFLSANSVSRRDVETFLREFFL